MNKAERAKARALGGVRTVAPDGAARFARQLAWLAEHEPETVLSAPQRWYLDALVWRYRRQVAGELAEALIPAAEPVRADYIQAAEHRRHRRRVALNGGIEPPEQKALI